MSTSGVVVTSKRDETWSDWFIMQNFGNDLLSSVSTGKSLMASDLCGRCVSVPGYVTCACAQTQSKGEVESAGSTCL